MGFLDDEAPLPDGEARALSGEVRLLDQVTLAGREPAELSVMK